MSQDDARDHFTALTAQLDQELAQAAILARWAMGMFTAARAEGFTPPQAMYFAVARVLDDPGRAP